MKDKKKEKRQVPEWYNNPDLHKIREQRFYELATGQLKCLEKK